MYLNGATALISAATVPETVAEITAVCDSTVQYWQSLGVVVFKNTSWGEESVKDYSAFQAEVNLVTALVPSDTACLASSPGRMRRTAVWISREVTVGCAAQK